MSLTSTLNSALSGLTMTSRAAEVIASNIANATTPGYGRREVVLSSRFGGGVVVDAVSRNQDLPLLNDRRAADAGQSGAESRAAALLAIEQALGSGDSSASISAAVSAFDAALLSAAGSPESSARLQTVLGAAQDLAGRINAAGAAIQGERALADARIADQVDTLNTALAQVQALNSQIRSLQADSGEANTLIDQRQQVVDSIAGIVPLREVDRGNGVMALYTTSGAPLVDGNASVFGFTKATAMDPAMTAGGALSGLTLNGRSLGTGETSLIAGGSLAADFAIRDELGPQAQAGLDALARDLVDRFADPGLDATLASGAAGLFTDAGAALDPLNETGLAQRLSVNAAVDPAQGGALWRLRDGLGATIEGPSGSSRLLNTLRGALTADRTAASGTLFSGAAGFADRASTLVSALATDRLAAEGEVTFTSARATALQQRELENGVDTDQELQQLLVIEKAYAANARVLQAADDMLSTLMEI